MSVWRDVRKCADGIRGAWKIMKARLYLSHQIVEAIKRRDFGYYYDLKDALHILEKIAKS